MTRAALLLILVLTASFAPAGKLLAATFAVHDDRAAREIGESTQLYIDDRLIASFRLDDATRQASLTVTVPARKDPDGHERHSYALCGTITVRNAQDTAEIHEVNATGTLLDPDGHRFEALGAADFTRFYLADPVDPAAAESLPQHSGLCHAPIS
jgi:hypothetical protein